MARFAELLSFVVLALLGLHMVKALSTALREETEATVVDTNANCKNIKCGCPENPRPDAPSSNCYGSQYKCCPSKDTSKKFMCCLGGRDKAWCPEGYKRPANKTCPQASCQGDAPVYLYKPREGFNDFEIF